MLRKSFHNNTSYINQQKSKHRQNFVTCNIIIWNFYIFLPALFIQSSVSKSIQEMARLFGIISSVRLLSNIALAASTPKERIGEFFQSVTKKSDMISDIYKLVTYFFLFALLLDWQKVNILITLVKCFVLSFDYLLHVWFMSFGQGVKC